MLFHPAAGRPPCAMMGGGDRFLYLTWGDVGPDGSFAMFRRAKLMLDRIDADLVRAAERAGQPMIATVDLTDGRGGPRCARVDPPALTWGMAQPIWGATARTVATPARR